MNKKIIRAAFLACLLITTSVNAQGKSNPTPHPVISEVYLDWDTNLLYISGQNFDSPEVRLGSIDSVPLTQVASTEVNVLVVDVTGIADGDYTLVVSQGKQNTLADEYDLTIGAVGPAGADGQDGAQGPAGPQGPVGPAGADGLAGADGQDGAQGPAGPQGQAGADGVDGAQGPEGPQGPQGPQGLAGVDGTQGPAGAQGPAGPQGPAGVIEGALTYAFVQWAPNGSRTELWSSPPLADGVYACVAFVVVRPPNSNGISSYRTGATVWITGGVASLRGNGIVDNLGGVGSGVIAFDPQFSVSGNRIVLTGGDGLTGSTKFGGTVYLYPLMF